MAAASLSRIPGAMDRGVTEGARVGQRPYPAFTGEPFGLQSVKGFGGKCLGISVFILLAMTMPKMAVPNVAPIERVSCVIDVAIPRSLREVARWTMTV